MTILDSLKWICAVILRHPWYGVLLTIAVAILGVWFAAAWPVWAVVLSGIGIGLGIQALLGLIRWQLNNQLIAIHDALLVLEIFSPWEGEKYEAEHTHLSEALAYWMSWGAYLNPSHVNKDLDFLAQIKYGKGYSRPEKLYLEGDYPKGDKCHARIQSLADKYEAVHNVQALGRGHGAALSRLLALGADANCTVWGGYFVSKIINDYNKYRRPLLTWSLAAGDLDWVMRLRRAGARFEADTLHVALTTPSLPLLQYVMAQLEAEPDGTDWVNRLAYHQTEIPDCYFPGEQVGLKHCRDHYGPLLPLSHLILRSDEQAVPYVDFLLAHGADPAREMAHLCWDFEGQERNKPIILSPLIYEAVKRGHPKVVRRLLAERPALLSLKGRHAYQEEHPSESLLHAAAYRGDAAMVATLCAADPDNTLIHAVNQHGETPLFRAVSSPHANAEVVALLLQQGATLSLQNDQSQTVLALAAGNPAAGIPAVMQTLLHAGAAELMNTPDHKGQIPIHHAAANTADFAPSLLQQMLEHPTTPANVEALDHDGLTPLAYGIAAVRQRAERYSSQRYRRTVKMPRAVYENTRCLLAHGARCPLGALNEALSLDFKHQAENNAQDDRSAFDLVKLLLAQPVDTAVATPYRCQAAHQTCTLSQPVPFLPIHHLLYHQGEHKAVESQVLEILLQLLERHPEHIAADWPFEQTGGYYGLEPYLDGQCQQPTRQPLYKFYQLTDTIRNVLGTRLRAWEQAHDPQIKAELFTKHYKALGFFGGAPSLSACNQRYKEIATRTHPDKTQLLALSASEKEQQSAAYIAATEAIQFIRNNQTKFGM